jgi:hypothetical protein
VREAIARAAAYGLCSEHDVMRFLELMYLLGFEFDADRTIAEMLCTGDATPTERLDRVWARAWLEQEVR